MFKSSGETAVTTNSNTAVTLVTLAKDELTTSVTIINEGSVAGFFSLDGGTTWARLPADCSLTIPHETNQSILVKRVADGTDLADVYGMVW